MRLEKMKVQFFDKLIKNIGHEAELHYIMTCLIQDWLRMEMIALNKSMPIQESKAVMKVILDTVLLDFGMCVQVAEFGKPS